MGEGEGGGEVEGVVTKMGSVKLLGLEMGFGREKELRVMQELREEKELRGLE